MTLHRFEDVAHLEEYLRSPKWSQARSELEAAHGDIDFEWPKLEAQARELAGELRAPRDVEAEEAILDIRRKTHVLRKTLRRARPSVEDPVLVGASHDLRDLLNDIGRLLISARAGHDDFESVHKFCNMFFFQEITEGPVDEARRLFAKGNRKRALARFADARAIDPFDPDIWNSEGACWLAAGDHRRAIECFEKAARMARHQIPLGRRSFDWGEMEVRPYVRARYNLALTRKAEGDFAGAAEIAEELLALCPGAGVAPGAFLAAMLHRQGHLSRAMELYERWAATPDEELNLAAARLEAGDLAGGIRSLLKGMSVNPYIVPLLLGEKPPGADVRHVISWEDPEWAARYIEHCGDMWDKRVLEIVRRVWQRPEIQEILNEAHAVRRTSKVQRRPSYDELTMVRSRLESPALARRLAEAIEGES
jgi:tetratricopeptide (TPR) repeat protein